MAILDKFGINDYEGKTVLAFSNGAMTSSGFSEEYIVDIEKKDKKYYYYDKSSEKLNVQDVQNFIKLLIKEQYIFSVISMGIIANAWTIIAEPLREADFDMPVINLVGAPSTFKTSCAKLFSMASYSDKRWEPLIVEGILSKKEIKEAFAGVCNSVVILDDFMQTTSTNARYKLQENFDYAVRHFFKGDDGNVLFITSEMDSNVSYVKSALERMIIVDMSAIKDSVEFKELMLEILGKKDIFKKIICKFHQHILEQLETKKITVDTIRKVYDPILKNDIDNMEIREINALFLQQYSMMLFVEFCKKYSVSKNDRNKMLEIVRYNIAKSFKIKSKKLKMQDNIVAYAMLRFAESNLLLAEIEPVEKCRTYTPVEIKKFIRENQISSELKGCTHICRYNIKGEDIETMKTLFPNKIKNSKYCIEYMSSNNSECNRFIPEYGYDLTDLNFYALGISGIILPSIKYLSKITYIPDMPVLVIDIEELVFALNEIIHKIYKEMELPFTNYSERKICRELNQAHMLIYRMHSDKKSRVYPFKYVDDERVLMIALDPELHEELSGKAKPVSDFYVDYTEIKGEIKYIETNGKLDIKNKIEDKSEENNDKVEYEYEYEYEYEKEHQKAFEDINRWIDGSNKWCYDYR